MDCENWYPQKPEPMTDVKGHNILWNFFVQTDRKTKSNEEDIVVKDYEKIYFLTDMSVPRDQ